MSRTRKPKAGPAFKPVKRAKAPAVPERRAAPRRKEDRTLREEEAFFRGIFETAEDCIFVKDKALRYVSVNPMMEEFLGIPAARLINRTDAQLFGRPSARQVRDHDRRVLRGETVKAEETVAVPGGAPRIFHVIKIPKRNDAGKIIGLYGVARDITEIKQIEEALRESEERYRAIVEGQTEVICRFKANGAYTFANKVYCRFFGKTSRELMGKKWQPQVVAEDLPVVERRLRMLSRANPVVVIENRVYSGSGEVRWMQFVNRAFFNAAGRLVETQAVGRDITERKKLESGLALREQQLNAFFSGATVGLALLDRDIRYLRINDTLAEMNGLPVMEHIGRTVREVVPQLAPAIEPIFRKVLLTGEPVLHIEMSGETPRDPGVVRHWVESFFPVTSVAGRVESAGAVVVEITELKRTQETLLRSREDMRLLAARLAEIDEAERKRLSRELHDRVGQTLTALGINLAHVLEEVAPSLRPGVLSRLKEACSQAEALADNIRGVMGELRPAVLDDYGLVAALRGYGQQVARRSGLAVTVEEEGDIGRLSPEIETALFRIVQEAVTNSLRHAHATGVCITCEKNANQCRLVVADNGIGFDAAAANARKTNWGLAIMRERARAVGAELSVHSRAGRGTTLVVYFPAPNAAAPDACAIFGRPS